MSVLVKAKSSLILVQQKWQYTYSKHPDVKPWDDKEKKERHEAFEEAM